MLSVLIAGKAPAISRALVSNLHLHLGCHFEVLYRHTLPEESLAKAWNLLARRAAFSVLAFLHDDIRFHSHDVGPTLLQGFQQGFDLLGVAGSAYRPALPVGWYTQLEGIDHYHIWHSRVGRKRDQWSSGTTMKNPVKPVLTLDGVLMACSKVLWQKVQFDDKNFTGFHGYDLDFSFRSSQLGKVGVVGGIELEHQSEGSFNDSWFGSMETFCRLHQGCLPAGVLPVNMIPVMAEEQVKEFWRQRLSQEPVNQDLLKPYGLSLEKEKPNWYRKIMSAGKR